MIADAHDRDVDEVFHAGASLFNQSPGARNIAAAAKGVGRQVDNGVCSLQQLIQRPIRVEVVNAFPSPVGSG